MSTQQSWPTLELDYRYEFDASELDAIHACVNDHGFAVVKAMLDGPTTQRMRQAVLDICDPWQNLPRGQTRVRHAFCDVAPVMLELLDNRPWLAIQEKLLGSTELTVNRCAAILKQVGSPPVSWHTDWAGYYDGPPRDASDVLNTGEHPSGAWFYLEGTHPSRAGLAIIPDSHTADWAGPQGYTFTENRKSFHPQGEPVSFCSKLDVPGVLPLMTDPGDMILFAARTYHYASAHGGDRVRCSAALGMRAGRESLNAPWPLPESVRFLRQTVPEHYRPYIEHYPGYSGWKAK